MATQVYKNALFELDGTDLSSHVTELTVNFSSEMLDETAMGDNTRIRKGGLQDWSFDVTFNQDFAAGAVDVNLFSLIGTTSCIEIRPQNICSTAINPRFTGIAVLENYPPLGGAVGSLLQVRGTWQSAGDLARATAAT